MDGPRRQIGKSESWSDHLVAQCMYLGSVPPNSLTGRNTEARSLHSDRSLSRNASNVVRSKFSDILSDSSDVSSVVTLCENPDRSARMFHQHKNDGSNLVRWNGLIQFFLSLPW